MTLCIVCGSASTSPYVEVQRWPYYRCHACRAVFLPKDCLGDQSQVHRGREYKLSRLTVEASNKKHNEWLLSVMKAIQPTGRVLEVGCGAGFLLGLARDSGYEVEAVDLGEENVLFADKFLGVKVANENFLEREDATRYAWIMMHQLLEHVPTPRDFVRKARALLAPNGHLFVTTPNVRFAKPLVLFTRFTSRPMPMNDALGHPPNHCALFEPNTLRALLVSEGFEVVALGHNPTGFKGDALTSRRAVRRGLDHLVLALNRMGPANLIGPNMYSVARRLP